MARVEFPEIRLHRIPALRLAGAPNLAVRAISDDSREVDPSTVFFARETHSSLGDRFVVDALEGGAGVVLGAMLPPGDRNVQIEQPEQVIADLICQAYGWGEKDLSITAVTGTNGKTTVCHLIAGLTSAGGEAVGVIGTLGWGVWSPHADYEKTTNTTPGLIENWHLIGQMVREGAREIVMEVSSHALSQARVEGLPIRTAVFTNLGRDHFDYHGDEQAYLEAKARLFALPSLRQAVLNADQAASGRMLAVLDARANAVRRLCFSLSSANALMACRPCFDGVLDTPTHGRMSLTVTQQGQSASLGALLAGRFNAENLLAALAARLVVGESLDALAERASRLKAPPGRMETFTIAEKASAVVDYAHSPDALENVLSGLRAELAEGACLGVVFGCGGDRDSGKRPLMGAIAERLADWVIVTNDNPRGEFPGAITEGILAGMRSQDSAEVILDRREAIREAVRRLVAGQPGDCLLVAGKGHETGQQIGEKLLPFDDRAVLGEMAQELAP